MHTGECPAWQHLIKRLISRQLQLGFDLHGHNCRRKTHMASTCTACFPLFHSSHKRIGNMHILFVQLTKKKKGQSQACQTPWTNRICKICHKRSGIYDKEQPLSDLFTTVTSWKMRRNRRKQTVNKTFIVGILLTSFDHNCSLEAKPTPVSFILLKSQTYPLPTPGTQTCQAYLQASISGDSLS